MSSVSRNTRSQTNPTPAPASAKIPSTPTKAPGTDTATLTQEALRKAAAEREVAINELAEFEVQLAAKRVANLKSLARPLPNDSPTHWGQGVVYRAGTSQVHCKEMDKVPSIYPLGTSQVHSEFSLPISMQFSQPRK